MTSYVVDRSLSRAKENVSFFDRFRYLILRLYFEHDLSKLLDRQIRIVVPPKITFNLKSQ